MNNALLAQFGLKSIARQGWLDVGINPVESVAAHSWGVSLLVLHFLPGHLDLGRALAFATLHDLPEALTGDLTPKNQPRRAEKQRLERTALTTLLTNTKRAVRLQELFDDYLAQSCEESRFVHQLDRLDMALQAVHYAHDADKDLCQFIDSADKDIHDPNLRSVLHWCREQLTRTPL